jgi:UDP-N-acetyl-D-mannosaminuronate dehydrogenase
LRKNLVKPSDIPLRSSQIIALVNELSTIFERMGLNTGDVLDAASTKWNFHRYSPGLVGATAVQSVMGNG